jgi:hypothetical protein
VRVVPSGFSKCPHADDYLMALEGMSGDSRGLWPAHSPDFTPLDFYLWGNFKDKVCRTKY